MLCSLLDFNFQGAVSTLADIYTKLYLECSHLYALHVRSRSFHFARIKTWRIAVEER